MGLSMKKFIRTALFVITALLFALIILTIFSKSAGAMDFTGERCVYSIKKFGIKAGFATLEYVGDLELGGKKVVLIVFTAKGFNFFDEEKIYADPETLLPVRVERDLNIFGKKENIVEYYDAQHNTVRIVKYKNGEQVDEVVFEQEQPIDNLYCFLYRYRQTGIFEKDARFRMYLPTKDVEFKIVGQEEIGFSNDGDTAWYMESQPREYRVWFGVGDQKIPLRIDGAVGLAKTAMILTEYESGK